MKQVIIASAMALAATTAVQAAESNMKLSQAECDSMWMQVNPSNAAKVPESAVQQYVTDLKSLNPDGDGTIEMAEWTKGCSTGLIKSSGSSGASSGTSGTDSSAGTSDRTPEHSTPTPSEQQDSVDGKTSDRTPKE